MSKCKVCKSEYIKRSITHKTCSIECSLIYIQSEKDKKKRQEYRRDKEKIKTLADYRKEAQAAFNAWIRWRDRDQPCISCQKRTGCKVNAGHYRSRGAMPMLAFEESNCHLQCEKCNSFLAGNVVEYRINLLAKIGPDKLAWLEGHHEPKRYRKEDLIAITQEYRERLRQAKKIPSD